MYMFSKKAYLEFEGIKSINNTAYLSEILKKLEEPPLVNKKLKLEISSNLDSN